MLKDSVMDVGRDVYGPLVDFMDIHKTCCDGGEYVLSIKLSFQHSVRVDGRVGTDAEVIAESDLVAELYNRVEQVVLSKYATMPTGLFGAEVRCTKNIPNDFIIMSPERYYKTISHICDIPEYASSNRVTLPGTSFKAESPLKYEIGACCLLCGHAELDEGVAHCNNPDTVDKVGGMPEMEYTDMCGRFLPRDPDYRVIQV